MSPQTSTTTGDWQPCPSTGGAFTDGSDETGPGWGGGRGDGPTTIGVTFDLHQPFTLRRVRLASRSPNPYWYISGGKLLGRTGPEAAWPVLATRERYRRSEGEDKGDEGERLFRLGLDLDLAGEPQSEMRLEIERPHS